MFICPSATINENHNYDGNIPYYIFELFILGKRFFGNLIGKSENAVLLDKWIRRGASTLVTCDAAVGQFPHRNANLLQSERLCCSCTTRSRLFRVAF